MIEFYSCGDVRQQAKSTWRCRRILVLSSTGPYDGLSYIKFGNSHLVIARAQCKCIPKTHIYMQQMKNSKRKETGLAASHNRQTERTRNRQAHNSPASHTDLFVRELLAEVPDEMPYTVQGMESKRHCEGKLERDLGDKRQSTKGSCKGCGLQMPAEKRRNEIAYGEHVEATRKGDTGDSVKHRWVPCDLRFVDREMRSDGPIESLLGQDIFRIRRIAGCHSRPVQEEVSSNRVESERSRQRRAGISPA